MPLYKLSSVWCCYVMVDPGTPRRHKADHDITVYFFTEKVAQLCCFLQFERFYIFSYMFFLHNKKQQTNIIVIFYHGKVVKQDHY
jgi:hypothetical protein